MPDAYRCAMPCHAMLFHALPAASTVNSTSGAWPSVLFPISLVSARSIHSADYAISDNACCPGSQAHTQSRLRVSGAPISTLAVLSSLSACLPSECWSSRSSSPSLGLELLLLACLPLHNFQWAWCNWKLLAVRCWCLHWFLRRRFPFSRYCSVGDG